MSKATPEVLWSQRSSTTEPAKNYVSLTISAPNVPKESVKIDLQPTKLTFSGRSKNYTAGESTPKEIDYAVDLELFGEVDTVESKINHTDRGIDLVLRKKELKEEYWPRLLKDNKKMHFLKTDFDKWVDEDEQDAAPDDEDYMSKMNPMGGDGGFGGIDFSKLGGAAGLGGAEEEAEASDDDEEMPELEGDDEKVADSAAKTTA